jgi:hypothetical protein
VFSLDKTLFRFLGLCYFRRGPCVFLRGPILLACCETHTLKARLLGIFPGKREFRSSWLSTSHPFPLSLKFTTSPHTCPTQYVRADLPSAYRLWGKTRLLNHKEGKQALAASCPFKPGFSRVILAARNYSPDSLGHLWIFNSFSILPGETSFGRNGSTSGTVLSTDSPI